MKRALVVAMVCALFIGLGAFAQFTGEWETTVTFYPAAATFDGFASFESDLGVTYEVSGWTFAMDSSFEPAGLTDMQFDVDGALGAFTLAATVDFTPMFLTGYSVVYGGVQTASACAGTGWIYGTKTVASTYEAVFDDLEATVEISIAGVDLGALFMLVGEKTSEKDLAYTYFNATPTYATAFASQIDAAAASYTVAASQAKGAGWKIYGAGSMGDMDVTINTWWNLTDVDLYTYLGWYGYPTTARTLSMKFMGAGDYELECYDCVSRFTGVDLLLEGFAFACTDISIYTGFGCCGWDGISFLLEDIGLGCCWDLGFDMLIGFTADSKTITLAPDLTIANACFTIEAAVNATSGTGGEAFTINGIDILGVGLSYSWNGITFSSETSFDLARNPILGGFYYAGMIYSPTTINVWVPVGNAASATFEMVDGECVYVADGGVHAISSAGAGYYELASYACERAAVWEYFEIAVDGDGCCGGGFDLAAAFYFGDIETRSDLDITFFQDLNFDGEYAVSEGILIYGDTPDTPPAVTTDDEGCQCCPCDDCINELNELEVVSAWTAKDDSRLFSWVKTTIEGSIGLSSNFDLTFALDVSTWGWEELEVGFDFSF